jgi:heat shock protein HslJ
MPASPGPASPGTAGPPTAADLDGRTFLSTGATGVTLVAGSTVRLVFTADTIAANAGCNSMSGGYAIDGGVLEVGMMAMTEMACQEPLMAQDTWLAAFLDGATAGLAGDTLTLAKGGVTLTLLDRRSPIRTAADRTRWVWTD